MLKVINGRTYNTETSKRQLSVSAGNASGAYVETLYINTRGNFFLHGLGGPMSPYRVRIAHDFVEGEKITPFTIDQAKDWVKSHANDRYEDIFNGPRPRRPAASRVKDTFSMDREVLAQLRAMSKAMHITKSRLVEDALREKYNLGGNNA